MLLSIDGGNRMPNRHYRACPPQPPRSRDCRHRCLKGRAVRAANMEIPQRGPYPFAGFPVWPPLTILRGLMPPAPPSLNPHMRDSRAAFQKCPELQVFARGISEILHDNPHEGR